MEKLKVFLSFEVTEKLSKVTIDVTNVKKPSQTVKLMLDLLPNYPLENYVRMALTQFNIEYGSQNKTPQENS